MKAGGMEIAVDAVCKKREWYCSTEAMMSGVLRVSVPERRPCFADEMGVKETVIFHASHRGAVITPRVPAFGRPRYAQELVTAHTCQLTN